MSGAPTLTSWLVAAGSLIGFQCLRAYFPLLVFVFRDRLGWGAPELGGLGFVPFAFAFLVPWFLRRRAPIPSIGLAVVLLATARAALQLWEGDPIGAFVCAALSLIALLMFLAAASRLETNLTVPFLLGMIADTSLHATAGTRDFHWGGVPADLVQWGLLLPTFVLGLVALRHTKSLTDSDVHPANESSVSRGAGLLVWGPFFFLATEWLGNVARLSARLETTTPFSGTLLVAGLVVGVILVARMPRAGFWAGFPAVLIVSTFFARGLIWSGVTGGLALPTLWISQWGAQTLLARGLLTHSAPSPVRDSLAFGASWVAFYLLIFGHYAGFLLPLPFTRTMLFLVAAALLLAVSLRGVTPSTADSPKAWPTILILAGLVLLPLTRPAWVQLASDRGAAMPHASAQTLLRVVTFNLHNGFDERGGWALETMLDSLAHSEPDVAALQEVSRGWVIHGSADLYELARERLRMRGTPGPSSSFDWGNAIFSRFHATNPTTTPLPPDDLLLPRAVTQVTLQTGATDSLVVAATHFHHLQEDEDIRAVHTTFLVDLLGDENRSTPIVLLGDFNAMPDSPSLAILRDAGFSDCFELGDPVATYPSRGPARRIDTIFVRGPVLISEASVAAPWGSDHRAVLAMLETPGSVDWSPGVSTAEDP